MEIHPRNGLIHESIERNAELRPRSLAVICGNEQLNYDQVNRRANQVAHALLLRGVRPDDRVALYLERGLEMVIGLLGILKAGGAYVPLDASYPSERLRYMLHDSAPLVV